LVLCHKKRSLYACICVRDILILMSTYERQDLTGLALTSLSRHKSGLSDVLILDDASLSYNQAWLERWGYPVERREKNVGVGPAAFARYSRFLLSGYHYLCALDNDVLVCPKFDLLLLDLWHRVTSSQLTVVTGYRSVTQKVVSEGDDYDEVDGVGGACHFVDRSTATSILEKLQTPWPHNWDHCISRVYEKKFAPKKSFIEHLGIFGSGVNGWSADVSVNGPSNITLPLRTKTCAN